MNDPMLTVIIVILFIILFCRSCYSQYSTNCGCMTGGVSKN